VTDPEGNPTKNTEKVDEPPPPLAPFVADAARRELEQEKLRLEIAALKRRWRPEYVSPLVALAIGAGTLTIAWTSGLFDVNSKLLEIRRHDLAAEVEKFQTQKDKLQREDEQLRTSSGQLTRENQKLALANKEEVRLGESLRRDLRVTELKASITALSRTPANLSLDDPTLLRVYALIEAAGPKSPEVQYAASAVDSGSVGVPLSAALCFPLERATRDPKWKQTMLRLATKEMSDSIRAIGAIGQTTFAFGGTIEWARPVIYLDLLVQNASTAERIGVIENLYQVFVSTRLSPSQTDSITTLLSPSSAEAKMVETLATWDTEATSHYPAFWLDHLGYLIRAARFGRFGLRDSISLSELEKLSPEAFGIIALVNFVEGATTGIGALPGQPATEDVEHLLHINCSFPTGFPLTCESGPVRSNEDPRITEAKRRFFAAGGKVTVLHLDMRDRYRAWLANNPRLTRLWTDVDLKALRSAQASLIGRAVKKEWLSENEAPETR
jgi:hypothetical protein